MAMVFFIVSFFVSSSFALQSISEEYRSITLFYHFSLFITIIIISPHHHRCIFYAMRTYAYILGMTVNVSTCNNRKMWDEKWLHVLLCCMTLMKVDIVDGREFVRINKYWLDSSGMRLYCVMSVSRSLIQWQSLWRNVYKHQICDIKFHVLAFWPVTMNCHTTHSRYEMDLDMYIQHPYIE